MTILGIGEAGTALARDLLAAGAEIARVLDGPGEPLLTRLLEGSRRHAVRRIDEMQAASLLLSELGVEPRVARSAVGWLEELAGERTR